MTHDTMILSSLFLGLVVITAGIVLNVRSGGGLWDLPTKYQPGAMYLYFGGYAIVLAGYAVAQIFFASP
jgi:hypothetical protein